MLDEILFALCRFQLASMRRRMDPSHEISQRLCVRCNRTRRRRLRWCHQHMIQQFVTVQEFHPHYHILWIKEINVWQVRCLAILLLLLLFQYRRPFFIDVQFALHPLRRQGQTIRSKNGHILRGLLDKELFLLVVVVVVSSSSYAKGVIHIATENGCDNEITRRHDGTAERRLESCGLMFDQIGGECIRCQDACIRLFGYCCSCHVLYLGDEGSLLAMRSASLECVACQKIAVFLVYERIF